MDTAPSAASSATNQGFVHLDVLSWASADPVLIRTNHAGAQFMENLKRCLVSGNSDLPLELPRGHTWRLGAHQVRTPKPYTQGRPASFHYRSDRQPSLLPALSTDKNPWAGRYAEWIASPFAVRANKTLRPSAPL